MNSKPRRTPPGACGSGAAALAAGIRARSSSLDILDLLAHLLELRLCRDDQLGDAQAVGFRAHRVHFAVHLLEQEIELAAARLRGPGERAPVRDVAAEALDLFADVGAG